jgi:hypothetical protein
MLTRHLYIPTLRSAVKLFGLSSLALETILLFLASIGTVSNFQNKNDEIEVMADDASTVQNLMGLKNFTWQDLDYSTVQLADELDPGNATADDFDLSPFYAHGGKLIHWHGLSDATVSPGASLYFHDHVSQTVGAKGVNIDDFYQLYLVPGLE